MSCVNCSNAIEKLKNRVDGIESSQVSFANNSGDFVIDESKIQHQELIKKITDLGFGVEEDKQALQQNKQKSSQKLFNSFAVSAIFTIIIYGLSFLYQSPYKIYIIFVLVTFILFYSGKRFYILAYKSLMHKNTDMNVLVAMGVSVSYIYSSMTLFFMDFFPENMRFMYFEGIVVIITFILLGRVLEDRSKNKTSNFLQKMMSVTPDYAHILTEKNNYLEIKTSNLKINDKLLIKSGQTIVSDATIYDGSTQIDESTLTGEAMSVYATVGSKIKAGTINLLNPIKVVVNTLPTDTTLAKIIKLLEQAQSKKMPIARLADKIANIFVPTVIIIATLSALIWMIFAQNYMMAILSFVSVLIISCPCAIGLATPIAIVSGISNAAKSGILIKNPASIENIKNIKYAVFDKTGTITRALIRVNRAIYENEDLQFIYALQSVSEHPISYAICQFCLDKNIKNTCQVSANKTIVGKGISGIIDNKKITIGNLLLITESKIQIDKKYQDFYEKQTKIGQSVIFVGVDKNTVAVFSLGDSLKDDAVKLINDFKKNNITTIMLSGDNERTCKFVADKIGIDKYYGELLPAEKYEKIKQLQKNGKLMFVGDGINDALSIKQADIGVAFHAGSDISSDAGDIVLMNNDLSTIYAAFKISKLTMKTIKQNLFWAFFYNIISIPIAAGLLYPFTGLTLKPAIAAIAMSFSSVSVVLNSLRIRLS